MPAKKTPLRLGPGQLFVPKSQVMYLKSVVLSVLAVTALQAQTPAPPNKGQQIVDQCVRALGGDRFLNMQTRHVTARIYGFFHDQMNGYDVANFYTQYLDGKE